MDPERFWTTLLVCSALELMDFSWLADEKESLTIVDKGLIWAERQVRLFVLSLFQSTAPSRRRSPEA